MITSLTIFQAGRHTTPTGLKLIYGNEATGIVSMGEIHNKGMINMTELNRNQQ